MTETEIPEPNVSVSSGNILVHTVEIINVAHQVRLIVAISEESIHNFIAIFTPANYTIHQLVYKVQSLVNLRAFYLDSRRELHYYDPTAQGYRNSHVEFPG